MVRSRREGGATSRCDHGREGNRPGPRIEPARAEEWPGIADLLRRCGLPDDGLACHLEAVRVARDGEVLVGCAALEVYGEAALLRSVAVDASRRGRGMGVRLTRAVLDLARERGVRTVYLLTTTAAGFFPRFGFRTVERSEVDPVVRRSIEFTSACPGTAHAMELILEPSGEGR